MVIIDLNLIKFQYYANTMKQWKSLQHQNQTLKVNNCITMYCNNCHIVYMISIKSNAKNKSM